MVRKTLNKRYTFLSTILAFAVIPISGLATDIYLPSMPSMATELGLAENKIQLTLSLFMISYGISQFFAGAIVDAFGRYRVSLLSLLLFVFSFYYTAHTHSIYTIYAMRILQGILSGFAIVSKRAFFVDVYQGEQRKHYLSIMTIVWSLAPIIAPFIGGYLQSHFGWQANFNFLAFYCALVLILEFLFSGETIVVKHPFKIDFLLGETSKMFKTPDFFYGMLMCGLSYSMVMFYNLCGPFIIEHKLGFSAITTGYVSLLMGLAWMCGGFLGKVLINRSFLPKLRMANFLQILLIVLMFASSYFIQNLYTLALFAFFIHFTAGFIFNNYFAYCLGRFPHLAGMAGGVTGCVAFVLTSAVSYGMVALIRPVAQSLVAVGYFLIAFIGFIVLTLIKIKKAHI
ncbi:MULTISPECIES: MFS transporter [Chitinophagaceae]